MIREVYYHFIENMGYKPSAGDIVRYLKIARNFKTTEKTVSCIASKHGLDLATVNTYPRRATC